jgi:hypothetical protein
MEVLQWFLQNWQTICGWITGLFFLFRLLRGFTKIVLDISSVVQRCKDAENTLALMATNHLPHMQIEFERISKTLDSMDTTLRKIYDKEFGDYA